MSFSDFIKDKLNWLFADGSSAISIGFKMGDYLSQLEAVKQDVFFTINAQVGTTYELVLADATKLITVNNASPVLVTVPDHATVPFAIGTTIDIIQAGAGKVTFEGAVGVTIKSKDSNKSIGAQNVAVSLIKESDDVWYLIGNLIV